MGQFPDIDAVKENGKDAFHIGLDFIEEAGKMEEAREHGQRYSEIMGTVKTKQLGGVLLSKSIGSIDPQVAAIQPTIEHYQEVAYFLTGVFDDKIDKIKR